MNVSRTTPDVDMALEHLMWIVSLQSPGKFPVSVCETDENDRLRILTRKWFDNEDPLLEQQLRAFIRNELKDERTFLYSVSSFSREQAKAELANPGRVIHVDADEGTRSDIGPTPTRIIQSSLTGEHRFWALKRPLPPNEIQKFNHQLTELLGGDKGGHSPAKNFRLPGTLNWKYEPAPRITITHRGIKQYTPEELRQHLSEAKERANNKTRPKKIRTTLRTDNSDLILLRLRSKLGVNANLRLRQRQVCRRFAIRYLGRTYTYPGDDRSEIIFGICMGLRNAGASPDEVACVIQNTIFWQNRVDDGKAENLDRLIERVFEDATNSSQPLPPQKEVALHADNPSKWEGLPVPTVQWILEGWIPFEKVTLLYGDGGSGKTLLALMLGVACACGLPFLGMSVLKCRVYALLAENDRSDTHRTLVQVCEHYRIDLGELTEMLVASRSGFDNILMAFTEGKGRHTLLFEKLLAEVKAFGTQLVILETAADLFGGNENFRSEVRTFLADCCGRIAREINGAVLLNAHPSVAGMRSGVGDGGSTAWNNTARSRLSLFRDLHADGSEDDPDIRILEVKKSNFGRKGERIFIRWRENVFVNENADSKHCVSDARDDLIVAEVQRAFEDDDPWSASHQNVNSYLVNWIKEELRMAHGAAKLKLSKLVRGKKIVEIVYDKHRHRKGLCTPEQAQKMRAKQSMKLRNTDT